MKKITLVLIIFLNSYFSFSQFHLGKSSRSIYQYFKDMEYEYVSFQSFGYKEFLVVTNYDFKETYYFDDNDICTTVKISSYNRDHIYTYCDLFNIPLDWKWHHINYNKRKLSVFTYKALANKNKLLYSITIKKT